MASQQLQLNGRPQVCPPDGAAVPLSAREAALLAWLHLEGPTPRSRLAGLLWPAGTEAQARANLRQALARLRRGAGELVVDSEGVLALAAGVVVADEAPGLLLGTVDTDAIPEFADWLATRREDQQRRQERDAAAQGQRCLAAGDLDGALAAADALLAAQPENESGWRLRMEALYLRGDRAAAIAAWDACRLALRQAFGIAPSAATNELGRLILASEAAPATPATLPAALPAALRRPPQLVGREALCQALARHLALGRSALLAGPGGVGKSRLLQHLAGAAEGMVWVDARPGDAVVPGGVMGQLLAAALARFAPPLDAATAADLRIWLPHTEARAVPDLRSGLEHLRTLEAVVRALSACHARGLRLLVVDDLQFADSASLELLHRLLGRWLAQAAEAPGQAPQLLMGARPQELPPAGLALLATLAGHEQGQVFEMAPLEPAAVVELVHSLQLPAALDASWGADGRQALAAALHATVGGSPAYVLEALRQLALDGFASWRPGQPLPVPASLRETLRRRVERLPAEALQLAQLAAVAQSDFDIELAEAALGRPALALAPLLAALEAAWVFDGARFSHDLVAEAVHSLLPTALVAPLHRRVAEHLIARGGQQAARIAHHLQAAGAAREAAPWLLRAGAAARARWQLAEAAEAFEAAALGLDAPEQQAAAFDAGCEALRCWVELRRFARTQALLERMAEQPRSVAERARLRARAVLHLFHSRRMGEAVAAAQTLADELAQSVADLPAEELVYALRAVCLAVQGGLPAARVLALCDGLEPAVRAQGGELQAGFALARGGTLLWDAQPLQASVTLEAAWLDLGLGCDPFLKRSVGNQLMRVRQALGDLPGACTLGQALLTPQAGADDASFAADVLSLLALMQVAQGQGAEGLRSIERLRACLQAAGEPMRELYAITIALCLLMLGRPDDARAELGAHTHPPGREGYALYDFALLVARARLARAAGEDPAPWCARLEAVGPLPTGGQLQRRVALAALGPAPLAELEALLQALRERGQHGLLRTVLLAAARAAQAEGARARAVEHAQSALALASCVEAWSDEPASVWWQAYEVLRACGAHDAAQAALAAGQRWVQAGVAQWQTEAERHAWCQGNPVHRALLAGCAEG
ncbi:AAA family ATPase [Inhella sp.]|uniref:AAA family ATPase n=1 Tax=Inhella sp. TaxID=1921806 RepID=UPI0035B2C127